MSYPTKVHLNKVLFSRILKEGFFGTQFVFHTYVGTLTLSKKQKTQLSYIPYARHYNPRFYTFYLIFEVHLCTMTFGLIYGYSSRAVSNQERVIVARVWYIE